MTPHHRSESGDLCNRGQGRWLAAGVCLTLVSALSAAVMVAGAGREAVSGYYGGPPPAHTGGFGEATCHDCHFEHSLNDADGVLAIDGLPDRYAPGTSYQVTVTLTRPGMRVGGFQLAARTASGEQLGTLQPTDERTEVATSEGVSYLRQTGKGTSLGAPDEIAWTLEWLAPDTAEPALFHAAANAANDDTSEFGDYIYTTEHRVEPAP